MAITAIKVDNFVWRYYELMIVPRLVGVQYLKPVLFPR